MLQLLFKSPRFTLLWQLVKTSFKMRYQNSFLGVLWVLIKPYSTFVVMYLVWSNSQNTALVKDYPLYLLSGIVMYSFFNELMVFGQTSLLDKANIILKVNFSRQIAVVATLLSAVINLFINLILVLIIAATRGAAPSILGLGYFGLVCCVVFLLVFSLSLFTSVITIRVRDLKNIFDLAMFFLFWLTPIMYELQSGFLGSGATQIIQLNPLTFLINQARAGLGIYGQVDVLGLLGYLVAGIIITLLGWRFFQFYVRRIAEYF